MRKLLYVPIIHAEPDLGGAASAIARESAAWCGEARWAKHQGIVASFWETIAGYFRALDASNLKIYQDGLPAGGELGRKIVVEAARRGSRNYQLILDLMKRGAEIRQTEDPDLLKEEHSHIAGLAQPLAAGERAAAYARYRLRKDQLTRERDKFIARAIAQTLQEGETGVLFLGSYHSILPRLPKDIAVQQVKERAKVNAYFKALVSGGNDARWERLARYLTSPCPNGRPCSI